MRSRRAPASSARGLGCEVWCWRPCFPGGWEGHLVVQVASGRSQSHIRIRHKGSSLNALRGALGLRGGCGPPAVSGGAFLFAAALCLLTVVDSVLMAGLGPGSGVGGQDLLWAPAGFLVRRFVEAPNVGPFSVFLVVGPGSWRKSTQEGCPSQHEKISFQVRSCGFLAGSGTGKGGVKDLGLSCRRTRAATGGQEGGGGAGVRSVGDWELSVGLTGQAGAACPPLRSERWGP